MVEAEFVINQYLGNLNVDGRTDANAWSQLAHDYFYDDKVSPHDPDSDCQLNYVIVIGDGMFTGGSGVLGQRGEAANRIARLRTDLGVKSLMVAYGDGIYSQGMAYFDALALKGSCDTAGSEDCEPTIGTSTED